MWEVQVRDEAGFEEVYRAHWPGLVRLAVLLVGSREVAEELVQDAFASFDPVGVEHPRAYLRTIVVNRCRSHLRRLRLERERARPAPVHDLGPELDGLWHSLQRLAPRRRAAVVLRYYEDLPIETIAGLLGCRPGTVSSLLHRALADLKKELDRDRDL